MTYVKRDIKPSPKKDVGHLGKLSHRDSEILAECPEDERGAGSMLALILLANLVIRAVAVAAALTVVNVNIEFAAGLGLVISLTVAAVDWIIMQGNELVKSEKALRRAGATNLPTLTTSFDSVVAWLLRIVTAIVIAAVTAGLTAIYLHEPDIDSRIAEEQKKKDAPIRRSVEETLDTERNELELQLSATNADLKSAKDSILLARDARGESIKATERRVRSLEKNARDLRIARRGYVAEESTQRDLARCELAGNVPGCKQTSKAGPGPRYRLAIARADAAKNRADRTAIELESVTADLAEARNALAAAATASRTIPEGALAEVESKHALALDALAEHDSKRAARVVAMIETNPARDVLDPDSLATRIWALGELARDKWFALAFFGIKLFAFCLEMLPIIASASTRSGEYALLRGRRLAALTRELTNAHNQDSIDDLECRVSGHRARQEAASQTRPATAEMNRWMDKIREAELESVALRKRRTNEWFDHRTTASSSTVS